MAMHATASAEIDIAEEDVDDVLRDTFPASDPPSWWAGPPGPS